MGPLMQGLQVGMLVNGTFKIMAGVRVTPTPWKTGAGAGHGSGKTAWGKFGIK